MDVCYQTCPTTSALLADGLPLQTPLQSLSLPVNSWKVIFKLLCVLLQSMGVKKYESYKKQVVITNSSCITILTGMF